MRFYLVAALALSLPACAGGYTTAQPDARTTAARPAHKRLDADTTYAVDIGDAPWEGERHAKVTIVIAFEFACQFCERSRYLLQDIKNQYRGDVRIVYKHFVVHPQFAMEPALAACAAAKQDSFIRFADLVWEEAFEDFEFSREHMEQLARKADLGMDRFRADRDGDCGKTVRGDQLALARLGTTGTPTFFINGRPMVGVQPLQRFTEVIDAELRLAEERIAADKDITAANYYDRFVVAEGERNWRD